MPATTSARPRRRPSVSALLAAALLLLVAAAPRQANAQSPPLAAAAAVSSLARAIVADAQARSTVRLAVLSFSSTIPADESAAFGAWLTEALLGALGAGSSEVTLLERGRLDLVLQENELAVSGVVDESQAKRIGRLLPLDAVVSGTFARFTDRVEVRARLVHVVTGRILASYTSLLALDADLALLFGPPASGIKSDAEEACQAALARIKALLRDLSAPAKVQAVVDAAVSAPFEGECAAVHREVLAAFRRYSIVHPDYRRFLLGELARIEYPAEDARAYEIFRYLALDGVIDAEEWSAAFAALRRIGDSSLSRHIAPLLAPAAAAPRGSEPYRAGLARAGELLRAAEAGQVGLPVPVTFNVVFFELMEALNSTYAKDNRLLDELHEEHGPRLVRDAQTDGRVSSLLRAMYAREADGERKLRLLGRITAFYNSREPDEKAADDLFGFAGQFELTEYRRSRPEELAKYPEAHLRVLVAECAQTFCRLLPFSAQYPYKHRDQVDFCLEQGIGCPGVIPSREQARDMVLSANWSERIRGAELLLRMGARAGVAEEAILSVYRDEEGGSEAEVNVFQKLAAQVLGLVPSPKPATVALLVDELDSLNGGVPDAAAAALQRIGRPAVRPLIAVLSGESGAAIYKAAVILGRLGRDAAGALPHLEALARYPNADIRAAAAKAVQAIRATGQ